MRNLCLIILVFCYEFLISQITSVEKVVSGDYIAIKDNKIKQLVLKKGNTIINRINVISAKNELINVRQDATIRYLFDENGRPFKITTAKGGYDIKYFNKNLVKSIIYSGKDSISTYYPDENNLKSITNELVLDGKKHIKRFVFNKKDSLLSYLEIKKDDFSFKIYLNKTLTRKCLFNTRWGENEMSSHFNNENYAQYDSLYYLNGKRIEYRKIFLSTKDSIIITSGDTITTQVYRVVEKNKEKQIEYKRVTDLEGYVYKEIFYNCSKPVKIIEYTYKPYYSSVKDTVTSGTAIWKIKTTTITNKKNKVKYTFPYKKNKFMTYKRGKFVCKFSGVWSDGPGAYVSNDFTPLFYDNYNISSPSIIFTDEEKDGIDRFTFIDIESKKYYDLDYYRLKFSDENKEKIASFTEPEKLRVPSINFSYLQSVIIPINYTIEVTTEDNKKYNYKLNDFIFKVTPIVDIIARNANVGDIDLNYYIMELYK